MKRLTYTPKAAIGTDPSVPEDSADAGFTLLETSVAMIIILIALMGVFYTFTYAITYNAVNATRTQCLAIMQQEVELLRSKKFSPVTTDAELAAGTTTKVVTTTVNGGNFKVTDVVDDDPFTDGVQTDTTSTIKEITISVKLDAPSPGWQIAVPSTVVMRRTRGN
jgi:prepilin-type N-terminal cleavage/methylation domain-containing protein